MRSEIHASGICPSMAIDVGDDPPWAFSRTILRGPIATPTMTALLPSFDFRDEYRHLSFTLAQVSPVQDHYFQP
jgi:hypothetical protein